MTANQAKIFPIVGDQGGPEPTCTQRNEDIVQQRRQFRAPAPVILGDCSDDGGSLDPVIEGGGYHPPGAHQGGNKLSEQTVCVGIVGIDVQLIRDNRR